MTDGDYVRGPTFELSGDEAREAIGAGLYDRLTTAVQTEDQHLADVARRAIAALADGNTLAAVNILRQELPNDE